MSTQNPFHDAQVRLLADLSRGVAAITSRPALDSGIRAISRLREGRARREAARKLILNSLHSLSIQMEVAREDDDVLRICEICSAIDQAAENLKVLGGAR